MRKFLVQVGFLLLCAAASFGQSWHLVSSPPGASKGVAALRAFGRTVTPLSDGYTYTSVPSGTYRALSSDIEGRPNTVTWTLLSGVPSTSGAQWQAIAWAMNNAGDVVTSFATSPNWSTVSGCPCGYYRLPRGTKTFVAAKGTPPNGVVDYIVPDAAGNLYSETGFGQHIQWSRNGGASWADVAGTYATTPYTKLGEANGGLFALAIINNQLYTGGEGGVIRCNLTMTACSEVAVGGPTYRRNVISLASNGGPSTAPSEIFEIAKSDPRGLSLLKYDSSQGTWAFVPHTATLGYYYDGFIYAIAKLGGAHEYIMSRFASTGSQLLHTTDAFNWTNFDSTGLPSFSSSYRSEFVTVNPLSKAPYLVTYYTSLDLYVYSTLASTGTTPAH